MSYAECRHYVESSYAECRTAECLYAECYSVEYHNAKCRYAEPYSAYRQCLPAHFGLEKLNTNKTSLTGIATGPC